MMLFKHVDIYMLKCIKFRFSYTKNMYQTFKYKHTSCHLLGLQTNTITGYKNLNRVIKTFVLITTLYFYGFFDV